MNLANDPIDDSLAALAHPVRRAILDRLRDGALTVGEIGAPYAMRKPTISRHLKVLEHAGLITRTIDGRQHRCRLRPDGIRELQTWIAQYERFWTGQLDALEDYLADDKPAPAA